MSEFKTLIDEEEIILDDSGEDLEELHTVIKHNEISEEKFVTEVLVDDLNEHKPKVKLHRKNNEIVKIEFICNCGERSVLDVHYVEQTKE
jgi:hypothetical protein